MFPNGPSGTKAPETERQRFIRELRSCNTLSEFMKIKRPSEFHNDDYLQSLYRVTRTKVIDNLIQSIQTLEEADLIESYFKRNRVLGAGAKRKLYNRKLKLAFVNNTRRD
jgi:hypothetical protein